MQDRIIATCVLCGMQFRRAEGGIQDDEEEQGVNMNEMNFDDDDDAEYNADED